MPDSPSPDAADDDRAPAEVEEHQPHWWTRVDAYLHRNRAIAATTKIVVTVIGSLVLTAGLIMMVTPGPGLVGIAAGLAILSTEWDWADRWLQVARRKIDEALEGQTEEETRRRRRQARITTVVTVGTVLLVSAYVLWKDWPNWSVDWWDRAQSYIGILPDLPGM